MQLLLLREDVRVLAQQVVRPDARLLSRKGIAVERGVGPVEELSVHCVVHVLSKVLSGLLVAEAVVDVLHPFRTGLARLASLGVNLGPSKLTVVPRILELQGALALSVDFQLLFALDFVSGVQGELNFTPRILELILRGIV